jgi:hypothetical protein
MNELIEIEGYPKYRLEMETLKVVSYYKDPHGRYRAPEFDDRGRRGYRLFRNGRSEFFSCDTLNRFVVLHKLKGKLNMRTSVNGVVRTGDWIIGSMTKDTGVFSMSTYPARHPSESSAKTEAARLAAVDKTKKFVVLKIAGMAAVQEVVWE